MEGLKPCPFCGGKAVVDHYKGFFDAVAYCRNCGCTIHRKFRVPVGTEDPKMEALRQMKEIWNRRAKDGKAD